MDVNIEIHALIDYKSYRSVWNGTSFNFIYCKQFIISASYLTQEVLIFKDIGLLTNTDYRNDFVMQLMWLIKGYSHLIIYYSWFSFPFSTRYCKFSRAVYLFFYVNYLPEYNWQESSANKFWNTFFYLMLCAIMFLFQFPNILLEKNNKTCLFQFPVSKHTFFEQLFSLFRILPSNLFNQTCLIWSGICFIADLLFFFVLSC